MGSYGNSQQSVVQIDYSPDWMTHAKKLVVNWRCIHYMSLKSGAKIFGIIIISLT